MSDLVNIEATAPAWDWFELGCELQNAGRHQEALSAFESAKAIDPNIPFLRQKMAFAHSCLRNYTTALDLFETLVRDMPSDVGAWSGLSINAFECRQWDKSLAAAEQAFKLNPNNAAQLHSYSIILREFGRFKRARHLLERAVSLDPENAELRVQLGLRQLEEGDYKNGWKRSKPGGSGNIGRGRPG